MTNAKSNIEMYQLKLIKSVFAVNSDRQPTEGRISIGVSLKNNGEFIDGGRQAQFVQRFRTSDPETAPFFLDVEFWALFLLEPPPLPQERPHYVRQLLPQIVFPYLREYVAETTRRGGFTPLIINQNIFGDEAYQNPEGPKWIH